MTIGEKGAGSVLKGIDGGKGRICEVHACSNPVDLFDVYELCSHHHYEAATTAMGDGPVHERMLVSDMRRPRCKIAGCNKPQFHQFICRSHTMWANMRRLLEDFDADAEDEFSKYEKLMHNDNYIDKYKGHSKRGIKSV